MSRKAYLILHINTKELKISGAGIYSEEYPTTDMIRAYTVCIYKTEGDDLKHAEKLIYEFVETYGHEWVKDLLNKKYSNKDPDKVFLDFHYRNNR